MQSCLLCGPAPQALTSRTAAAPRDCVDSGRPSPLHGCSHPDLLPRPQAVQTTAALHDEAALYQKLADRAAKARETADAQPAAEGTTAAQRGRAQARQQMLRHRAGTSRSRRPATGEPQQPKQQQTAAEQAKAASHEASEDTAAQELRTADGQQPGTNAFREVNSQQPADALP